mgnify:FL=1
MRAYILTVIGAAVLSSFASILTPDKWRKYVGVITGLVIISCIIAPISRLTKADLFSGFGAIEESEQYSENLRKRIVREELEKRVGEDLSARLLNEFNADVRSEVKISINENNEITGISSVRIKGIKPDERITARICEIYGLSEDKISYE